MSQTLAANETFPITRQPANDVAADKRDAWPDYEAVWNSPEAMRKVWQWIWGPEGEADVARG